MPKKRLAAEQIFTKLRQVKVDAAFSQSGDESPPPGVGTGLGQVSLAVELV